MNIIELEDIKNTPDIFHNYPAALKTEGIPLVIENGSYKCRVGWSVCDKPMLDFRNLITKQRRDRKREAAGESSGPLVQIGNDVNANLQLKTQFDRNIITHIQNQELVFDYMFKHLGIKHDGCIPHPILLTEALGNPTYYRKQMSELLFECYGVPAASYCVDALLSGQYQRPCFDTLIVSFGYHVTHVIPVLGGRVQLDRIRRLNVGGYHITMFFHKLMMLKYPVHSSSLYLSRMEHLLHKYGRVAYDYHEELKQWADADYYTEHIMKIQLPYSLGPSPTTTAEQKLEKRKENARRLVELNMRRAKEKLIEDEELMQALTSIRALHESGEVAQFKKAIQARKITTLQALDRQLTNVRSRVQRAKKKLEAREENPDGKKLPEKLPPRVKPAPSDIPLETWLADIRAKRAEIIKRKQARKTRRQEMGKRRTVAAQERMRIISSLARNTKGTDEFGMNDRDWDVYKVINRDNDSDSDAESEKLIEFESILKYYDPNYEDPNAIKETTAESYQLHVGVEFLRAPELLFQPSMIGNPETGVPELIQFVLKFFTADEQQRLVDNIYLTGGTYQYPGLKERLSRELTALRPFQTSFSIYEADSPQLDAWFAAVKLANSAEFADIITTKEDYHEHGPDYFKTHRYGNRYYASTKKA